MVFTKNGKTYPWELTVGVALRVKNALGVDLLSPEQKHGEMPLALRLETDDLFFCSVYAEILRDQITGQGETVDQFLAGIDGELLLSARADFVEKYTAFFRQAARTDRVTLLNVATEAARATRETAEKEYVKSAGKMFGSSPAESESTQKDSL